MVRVRFTEGKQMPKLMGLLALLLVPALVAAQANPNQIALLRWYDANQILAGGAGGGNRFAVGSFPDGIAFDGANIWVANKNDSTVSKLKANDGSVVGTYAAGQAYPTNIAFDGANMWLSGGSSNGPPCTVPGGLAVVTKLRASDGSFVGCYAMPVASVGIAFDGANIWVANYGVDGNTSNTVTKLKASDGSLVGTYTVGLAPWGVAVSNYNGEVDIWVTNSFGNTVTRLKASDGTQIGTPIAVGTRPMGIAFDGTNLWVANDGDATVTKLKASNGNIVTGSPYWVGSCPRNVAFDGTYIWATGWCGGDPGVTKLKASDGSLVGRYPFFFNVLGVAFDGANVWVSIRDTGEVSKM